MQHDPIWEVAWGWVTRQHEGTLDDAAQAEFANWLHADPQHRRSYDDAARLWRLTGLVPPANELDAPGCPSDDER
ncbi:hypothetical protein GCM10007860_34480 [Chitiniphilus shinanonensis]|uniref:FecR N-terminal domain-containing protein n=1 Tax=Chitiniphilus shinanonensis TaxID=553088 RepID=A0ABQ6BY13_9NEIS|nr:FecR/PupR family sigma factor regulator [Chitiniphilus shinanonensis]GLS06272.1 hypothetical protein GCM10007860_34480 [Chitiniphilus shinanonensis]